MLFRSENQMPNLFETGMKPAGALPPEESAEFEETTPADGQAAGPIAADLDAKSAKKPKDSRSAAKE